MYLYVSIKKANKTTKIENRKRKKPEDPLYKSTLIRSARKMEENDSNEDILSQPSSRSPTDSTDHTVSTDSTTQLPNWSTNPFNSIDREATSAQHQPSPSSNDITQLKAQLLQCQKQLEAKDDRISELGEHILSLETDWTKDWNSFNKKRKFSNSKPAEEEDDELQKVKKENQELKKRIDELLASKEVSIAESSNIESEPKASEFMHNEGRMGYLIETIEKKISKGFETIQSNVENMINSKLGKLNPEKIYESNQQQTYAGAVGNATPGIIKDRRTQMLVNKNEEMEEERDRKSRAKNIIIHGKFEIGKADDKFFSENLIKELQIGALKINQIERIGKEAEGGNGSTQKRPMKLIMNNEEDKDKVLHNLKALKGKSLYKGISITADYTYSERQLVRDYREQANEKNDNETANQTNYIWRVRGTPKNGLSLKRFVRTN